MRLLLKNIQLVDGRRTDLRVHDGRIQELASGLAVKGEPALDAQGLACGMALQDHHIHLRASAARSSSWVCDEVQIRSPAAFAAGLRQQPCDTHGWIRVLGYHPAHCGELDGARLDQIRDDVAVRVQHVSGRLWVLNQRARELLGEGPWTEQGLLWDQDAWLSQRLGQLYPQRRISLAKMSKQLARFGVVGVTDTSPQNKLSSLDEFRQAQASGELRQRLMMMGDASLNPHYIASDGQRNWQIGAQKFHLLESCLPDWDELCAQIEAAHRCGRPVAFHCVSRTELVFALAALRSVGTIEGDRIEHAGICPDDVLDDLRGLWVVTQPVFIHDRGDRYRTQVETKDQQNLYRLGGLQKAGIELAGSSDSPYGSLDPWRGIATAMDRKTRQGEVIAGQEALSFRDAYALWTGSLIRPVKPRSVQIGETADLCVWDRTWSEIEQQPQGTYARLTLKAGETLWHEDL